MPSKVTRAPVGSTPHSDPRCVPTAVQCTAERSPSVTVDRTSSAKSGKAAKKLGEVLAHAARADRVDLPGDVLVAVRRPQRRHRLDVAARERGEVVVDRLAMGRHAKALARACECE